MAPNPVVDPSSRWLAHVLTVVAIGLPMLAAAWLGWSSPPQWAERLGDGAVLELPLSMRLAIGALAMLPVLCVSTSLWFARTCFMAFSRGEHFTPHTIGALRACARAMFATGIAGLLVPTLIGLVASGGQRVSVDVGSGQVLILLFGAVVWKVASAFARGMALAEENAQFV
jgi:hypothetical protein